MSINVILEFFQRNIYEMLHCAVELSNFSSVLPVL